MGNTVGNSRAWIIAFFIGIIAFSFAAAFNCMDAVYPYFYGDDFVRTLLLTMLFMLVSMWAAYWFLGLLAEAARLLCIPVAGWRFVPFRFRQGGGRRAALLDPPPLVNGECPCVCYLLCGGLSSLLLGILLIGISFFTPIGGFLRFFGFLAFNFTWWGLFPRCFGGTGSDGYWLLRIRNDPKQSAVLRLLQKLTVETNRAETYADFSEETVNALMEYECGDFSFGDAVIPLYYRAHYLFAQGDRAGASAVYRMIAESAAPDLLKGRAYCELLYAALFDGTTKEELFVLYERVSQSGKHTRDNTSRRRLMYAVRLVCEKNEARAEEEYQALLRLCRTERFRAQAALDLREAKRVRALYGSGSDTEVVSKNTAQVEIKREGEKTSKKSVIVSSIFPSLSVILSIVLIVAFKSYELYTAFTIALGIVCGGAVPLFLIIVWKTDISVYWIGKTILLAAFWAGLWFTWFVIPNWTFGHYTHPFVLPILILIAEIVFAATRKANFKTKLCLILSGPIWLYVGFTIDLLHTVEESLN